MSEANANIFKAIDAERRGTTFQEVVSQLREMIHHGELRPGDRLPPDRSREATRRQPADTARGY